MSKASLRWNASEVRQLILIIIIFVAACIETDIYLPAFPDMMTAFQVSESTIQQILTWNFIGLCLSGPLLLVPLWCDRQEETPLFRVRVVSSGKPRHGFLRELFMPSLWESSPRIGERRVFQFGCGLYF